MAETPLLHRVLGTTWLGQTLRQRGGWVEPHQAAAVSTPELKPEERKVWRLYPGGEGRNSLHFQASVFVCDNTGQAVQESRDTLLCDLEQVTFPLCTSFPASNIRS